MKKSQAPKSNYDVRCNLDGFGVTFPYYSKQWNKWTLEVSSRDKLALGVFHNNDWIYSISSKEKDQVKDYVFRLGVTLKSNRFESESEIYDKDLHWEIIEFTKTISLDQIPIEKLKIFGDELEYHNYSQFVQTHVPEQYAKACQRLDRFYSKNPVEPKYHYDREYCKDLEFLEFDETACNWNGPFTQDGKKGCVVFHSGVNQYRSIASFSEKDFNLLTNFSSYDLPYNMYDKYKHWDSNTSYQEKLDVFNSLSGIDKQLIFDKLSQRFKAEDEFSLSCYPYRVVLQGNDDTSYTRGFDSQEEVDQELQYLRRMQPLNMIYDVYWRGYIFTN